MFDLISTSFENVFTSINRLFKFPLIFIVFNAYCFDLDLSRIIVGKIDENKDGFVDMSELKNWITFTQRRYIDDDVNRQWKSHNPENTDKIHWDVSEELF